MVVALPFTLTFDSMTQGVALAQKPLSVLSVMYFMGIACGVGVDLWSHSVVGESQEQTMGVLRRNPYARSLYFDFGTLCCWFDFDTRVSLCQGYL